MLVEELVEEEIIIAGIREITVPDRLRLLHQLTGIGIFHHYGDITLLHPAQFVVKGEQDRCIAFIQGLLMIIFHHTDNLHRLVYRFHGKAFANRGIGRGKAQCTDGCLIQDDIIYISPKVFAETTAGNKLQVVGIQIIVIATEHFQQAGLLRGITQTDNRQEICHLRPGNSTGNRHILYGR